MDTVRFRDGILSQALGNPIVELFLNREIFDAALFHNWIDRGRPSLKDVSSFDIGHEHSAHSVTLSSDERCKDGHAEAGVIKRQLGKVRQHAAATRSDNLVDPLGADESGIDMSHC